MGPFFFGSTSEIVYKLMVTLCQIKIANNNSEYWGINSKNDLLNKLRIFSKKFTERQLIKDRVWLSETLRKEAITTALDHQSHQSVQAQVLYQLKNNYRNPSFFELDSS